MFELILKGNPTYSWTTEDNFCFIGFLYGRDGKTLRGKEAAYLLNELYANSPDPEKATSEINGVFSYLRIYDNKLTISSDIVNFLPIFYLRHEQKWIISDNWNSLVEYKKGLSPNHLAAPGFLSAGFVCGNKTLDSDIYKTRAGSTIDLYLDGKIETVTDFNFIPDNFSSLPYESLIAEAEECFLEAGKRMILFLNGRTAMLPLSGGFDSRMIACILKRLGYQNVICFTYGKKTIEVEMSRKVAEALGYKWYYIDYSNIDYKSYTRDDGFIEYMSNYSNGYSMFYLQEYFAMRELIKDNLIPADSVFLPGHSGDYLGGSYVEKTAATSTYNHKLAAFLESKYFFFKRQTGSRQKILLNEISETLKEYPSKNHISSRYNPYVEDWDIKEKLSKFIFRSSYVFTHFGFEHIFPLWDRQLVAFFRSLPFEYRSGKKLYDKTATERFFIPLGVSFKDAEIRRSSIYVKYQQLKDKTRNAFPWSIVLKRMIKNDWLNYYGFTREMEADLILRKHKPLKKYKLFTAIICSWYLDFIGFPKDKY